MGLAEAGRLVDDTVVATVMSNLGFVQAMEAAGLRVRQTRVGDRYVLEEMRAGGYVLGGEQSGHVIMSQYATTGDGILTALHLLQRMVATGKDLQSLASVVTRLPQVLVNVTGVDKDRADDPVLAEAVADRGAGAGRPWPGAAAAVRHRAPGPGDGGGAHRRDRARGGRPAGRRGARTALPELRPALGSGHGGSGRGAGPCGARGAAWAADGRGRHALARGRRAARGMGSHLRRGRHRAGHGPAGRGGGPAAGPVPRGVRPRGAHSALDGPGLGRDARRRRRAGRPGP